MTPTVLVHGQVADALGEKSQSLARFHSDLPEYQPDFVAETDDAIWMLEVKMKSEMDSPDVLAKKQAAETWCGYASDHAKTCGGKPWRYALIAHDLITENMSLSSLVGPATEHRPGA